MYKCPKCGGTGHKERIEITNEEGECFRPSTGDIVCESCGYVGSQNDFENTNDSVKDEK